VAQLLYIAEFSRECKRFAALRELVINTSFGGRVTYFLLFRIQAAAGNKNLKKVHVLMLEGLMNMIANGK
jgi:hypothetical protein